jgi:capsular polysaccharide biosynthesis protein
MENLQYSKILKSNWDVVALIIGITVVLSLIISLVQPFQYEASTQILIIQKQELNTDAYTATKSAERIGKNLASIIYTSSFYSEVIDSNSTVESKFSQDSIERRKEWKKNVKATVLPETGILEINVFDVDRNYASQLVRTIAYVLVNKGIEYHGGGSNVEIKVVDDVFMSKYPMRPNVILNSLLALIIGFILGSIFVILNEAKKLNKDRELKAYKIKENHDYDQVINVNEQPIAEDNWQTIEAQAEKDFGFVPEEPEMEKLIVNPSRNTKIRTMYDDLR